MLSAIGDEILGAVDNIILIAVRDDTLSSGTISFTGQKTRGRVNL